MKTKIDLLNEIEKIARECVPPAPRHLNISLEAGEKLAKIYNADITMVKIGIYLMDIKLSEAMKNNVAGEHTKMAVEFAKEYLKNYDLTDEEYNILINSVEAHHGKVPFNSIESEICANADCYRFIHPSGVFTYMGVLAKRTNDFFEQIKQIEFKLDEKYNILSLKESKDELQKYYEQFKEQFNEILKP